MGLMSLTLIESCRQPLLPQPTTTMSNLESTFSFTLDVFQLLNFTLETLFQLKVAFETHSNLNPNSHLDRSLPQSPSIDRQRKLKRTKERRNRV